MLPSQNNLQLLPPDVVRDWPIAVVLPKHHHHNTENELADVAKDREEERSFEGDELVPTVAV